MPPDKRPYAAHGDGVRLAVRVTPRAKQTALGGVGADADGRAIVLVKLAAAPVEGAANAALIAYVAKALKLARRDVAIVAGAQSRSKVLQLTGDGGAIITRLQAWLGA